MSASEWLPLNMQSGEKHVRPAVGLGRQIASGSLIRWSLEGPNWIMDSEVSVCVCVRVCVCLMRQAKLGGRALWPPYLGPSVSIKQHDRHSPSLPRPLSIRSPAPTRVFHYGALPVQCLETSPEEAAEMEREMGKVLTSHTHTHTKSWSHFY